MVNRYKTIELGVPKSIYVFMVSILQMFLKVVSKVIAKLKPRMSRLRRSPLFRLITLHAKPWGFDLADVSDLKANEREYKNMLKQEIKDYDRSDILDQGILHFQLRTHDKVSGIQ